MRPRGAAAEAPSPPRLSAQPGGAGGLVPGGPPIPLPPHHPRSAGRPLIPGGPPPPYPPSQVSREPLYSQVLLLQSLTKFPNRLSLALTGLPVPGAHSWAHHCGQEVAHRGDSASRSLAWIGRWNLLLQTPGLGVPGA